jgi:hypothetical protein
MHRLTAGLNIPPLTRKNAHALIAKENPNASDMNKRIDVFGVCVRVPAAVGGAAAFATCVEENAMNKNMKVPQNSPMNAIISFRHLTGTSLTIVGWSRLTSFSMTGAFANGRRLFLKNCIEREMCCHRAA